MVDMAEDDSQKVENWHFTLEQESLLFLRSSGYMAWLSAKRHSERITITPLMHFELMRIKHE
jgi:hypothetical protein